MDTYSQLGSLESISCQAIRILGRHKLPIQLEQLRNNVDVIGM